MIYFSGFGGFSKDVNPSGKILFVTTSTSKRSGSFHLVTTLRCLGARGRTVAAPGLVIII